MFKIWQDSLTDKVSRHEPRTRFSLMLNASRHGASRIGIKGKKKARAHASKQKYIRIIQCDHAHQKEPSKLIWERETPHTARNSGPVGPEQVSGQLRACGGGYCTESHDHTILRRRRRWL